MAVNKVIDRNNNVLIDLTSDTVKPENVLAGTVFHDNTGNTQVGILPVNEQNSFKYTFIDYDGEELYSFSDAEIDSMTELPAGPVHEDDVIVFQEWNWTLEELKNWNRTRIDRPVVGATYQTIDGKSYVYLEVPFGNSTFSFTGESIKSVDWGDGTVDTNKTHTYAEPGEYTVKIEGLWYIGYNSISNTSLRQWIKKVRLGNMVRLNANLCASCYNLESVTIPNTVLTVADGTFVNAYKLPGIVLPRSLDGPGYQFLSGGYNCKVVSIAGNTQKMGGSFTNCFKLQKIVLPDTVTSVGGSEVAGCGSLKSFVIPNSLTTLSTRMLGECRNLETIVVPEGVTTMYANVFNNCQGLKSIVLPDTLKSIASGAFQNCSGLTSITIPDSVTSIGDSAFSGCYGLVLDLSKQTKVIPITSSIGTLSRQSTNKILVPLNLLDSYKSASYWSSYASIMLGV